MEVIKLLVLAGVFVILTPGILTKLPSHRSLLKVAAVHAILFGLVYLIGTHLFQSLEAFLPKRITLAANINTFTAAGITAAAARAGYAPLVVNKSPGLWPSFLLKNNTTKCAEGQVFDIAQKPPVCIPMPKQYILPPVPAASVAQTLNGGGILMGGGISMGNSNDSQLPAAIYNIGKIYKKDGRIQYYCPPGYVNTGNGCKVAPTTVLSYLNPNTKPDIPDWFDTPNTDKDIPTTELIDQKFRTKQSESGKSVPAAQVQ